MSSPFRNFDAWLTTDRAAEEADAWDQHCIDNDLDPNEDLAD